MARVDAQLCLITAQGRFKHVVSGTTLFGYNTTIVTRFVCLLYIQVVGPKTYNEALAAELERVANLDCTGVSGVWKNAGKNLEGRAYQARWPDTWKEKLKAKVDKTYCNVIELVQHAIDEGNRLFADTPYSDTWYVLCACML